MTQPFNYQIFFPSTDLNPYVKTYEIIEYHDRSAVSITENLMPSGNPYLMVCFKGSIKSKSPPFDRKDFPESHVCGQFVRNISCFHFGFGIIAVFFKPEKFHGLIRENMLQFTHDAHHLTDVFGSTGNGLVEKIRNANTYRQMAEYMDDFLRSLLSAHKPENTNTVQCAIQLIDSHPEWHIDQVCGHLKVSGRHLSRLFKEKVGIGPKYYLRIKRLHKAVALANSRQDLDMQDIIYHCGYYDQPHFIKDFKQFTGIKPFAYLRKSDRNLEVGGVHTELNRILNLNTRS